MHIEELMDDFLNSISIYEIISIWVELKYLYLAIQFNSWFGDSIVSLFKTVHVPRVKQNKIINDQTF